MKRIISLLLTILTVCTLTIGISGCGGASKSAVVGVWKFVGDGNQSTSPYDLNNLYLYIYKDGTGDSYGKPRANMNNDNEPFHANAFTWEIEGEYLAFETNKYTVDGNVLYDKQGKKTYEKVSDDTSVDIDIP